MNQPCEKRLQAPMPATLAALEMFGEVRLSSEVRERPLFASASTADRLLASERRKLKPKSRRKTPSRDLEDTEWTRWSSASSGTYTESKTPLSSCGRQTP